MSDRCPAGSSRVVWFRERVVADRVLVKDLPGGIDGKLHVENVQEDDTYASSFTQ